jgi:hypothetical protein
MFILSKPCASTTPVFLRGEVDRALERLAWDIERSDAATIYKIAPGRMSMFAPYSQVHFWQGDGQWWLRLELNRYGLGLFAALPFAGLLLFRIMGPIRPEDALLPFGLFYGVYGLALLESRIRLSRWWNLL